MRSAAAWIHLGANFGAAVGGGPLLQASTAELQDGGLDALRRFGAGPVGRRPAGEAPAGEARRIHDGGGTYLSIVGANGLFHHPADRWPDAVDVDRIARYAQAFIDVGLQLANA